MLLDQGDFETAVAALEGVMMLAQDAFGQEHWLSIAALRDMGFAYRQMGMAGEADAFYNEAYAMSAALLGEAHPRTQHIAELMAELFSAASAFEESAAMREVIVANYEASFGRATC